MTVSALAPPLEAEPAERARPDHGISGAEDEALLSSCRTALAAITVESTADRP